MGAGAGLRWVGAELRSSSRFHRSKQFGWSRAAGLRDRGGERKGRQLGVMPIGWVWWLGLKREDKELGRRSWDRSWNSGHGFR